MPNEPVTRPNFYNGRLLTADDLRLEQEYHVRKRWLSNRILGWGIVEGLAVELVVQDRGAGGVRVIVSPGVALDPSGREIVLTQEARPDMPAVLKGPRAVGFVTATWDEVPDGAAVPDTLNPGGQVFPFWLERPLIQIVEPQKVEPDSVVLARITRVRRDGFALDHSVRQEFHQPEHRGRPTD